MFRNRIDAGNQLAERLLQYKNMDAVVLAIPRGGLPLGAVVAKILNAPLDVALSKKIGHPFNKEYAIGAVSLESMVLSDTRPSEAYIEGEVKKLRNILAKRRDQYYKNTKPQSLKDKIVIIVDDGIATGNTILATIQLVSKQEPAKIVVAIPVAPKSTLKKLKNTLAVAEVICLETPSNFRAVGQFYEEFFSVSDSEAIQILEEYNKG